MGAYYGALTPVVMGVDADMTDTERLLTTLMRSRCIFTAVYIWDCVQS